jgi:hypothetical protein
MVLPQARPTVHPGTVPTGRRGTVEVVVERVVVVVVMARVERLVDRACKVVTGGATASGSRPLTNAIANASTPTAGAAHR